MMTVPTYFQRDDLRAQRCQVAWLQQHLGLTDKFFSQVLGTSELEFVEWQSRQLDFGNKKTQRLAQLWQLFLHLLSLTNFDEELARQLLSATAGIRQESDDSAPSSHALAWEGKSIREYLQADSPKAIDEVTDWLTSLRFRDRTMSIAD